MNAQPTSSKLLLALSFFAIANLLLGWYLAAHHVFWLVSFFVVLATLALTWKSNLFLEFSLWLSEQQVFVLIGVSLLFSLLIALFLTQPILLSLIPLPFITLIYSLMEMRAANFPQSKILLWCVTITVSGLSLGELFDLFVIPSMRY